MMGTYVRISERGIKRNAEIGLFTKPSLLKLYMRIYTLGTGLRSEENVVGILKHFEIEVFLDVRSYPKSRVRIFNRADLEEILQRIGIHYHFLGKELGGFRKKGYEKYALTESFSRGVDNVERIARKNSSVIVCAETLPWKCHRRFIALELQSRGWEMLHIIEKDKFWNPRDKG
jgi:uncharacterized protein (DUF488 family)